MRPPKVITATIPYFRPVAVEFCKILKEWLTPEELAEAVALNKAEPNESICHSHDFCDANVAMDEAFARVLGFSACATGGEGIGCMSDHAQEIFTESWNRAKDAGFDAGNIPFKKGDEVWIKPEWQDKGDDKFHWIAVESEHEGRLGIMPVDTGLPIPPWQTVESKMLVRPE